MVCNSSGQTDLQSIYMYCIYSIDTYLYSIHRFSYNILGCLLVLLTQYCAGDKIEKNEMGWTCGAYG